MRAFFYTGPGNRNTSLYTLYKEFNLRAGFRGGNAINGSIVGLGDVGVNGGVGYANAGCGARLAA